MAVAQFLREDRDEILALQPNKRLKLSAPVPNEPVAIASYVVIGFHL
jgi:hypothetical protein